MVLFSQPDLPAYWKENMAIQEAPYVVHQVEIIPMHAITLFVFKQVARIPEAICAVHELVRPLHSCRHKDSAIKRF